ncbi:MAG: hypothetical protein PWQ96_1648 [Clostridia bacterium]|jgi:hypothetical protein|nr:hypothetical protein [Clostridia bacterium]
MERRKTTGRANFTMSQGDGVGSQENGSPDSFFSDLPHGPGVFIRPSLMYYVKEV